MTTAEPLQITSDERVMGALGHFFGLIASLIVWITQKDKSRFLRFQSLQALAFDGLLIVVSMFLTLCLLGVMLLGVFGLAFTVGQNPNSPDSVIPISMASMLFPFGMFACILPFSLAAFVARTIAAVSVASGHNFHYPILGRRVEAWLGEPAASAPKPAEQQAPPPSQA